MLNLNLNRFFFYKGMKMYYFLNENQNLCKECGKRNLFFFCFLFLENEYY